RVFAAFPYLAAFVGFELVTMAAYLWIARRALGDTSGTALLALVAFPIVLWNVGLGQNAFLTAALFGAATVLVDRRPVLAGLCFGALCYKPHLALLVPVALAASGRWRCFAAAAAAAAGLAATSVAAFGWGTWRAFFITAGASHEMYESGRILFTGFASVFGGVRLLGGSVALAYALQGVAAVAAGAVVAVAWRRAVPLPTRAAVLAAGALLASPVSLLYDLMLPALAACWLLRGDGTARLTPAEKIVLAGLFVLLLDPRRLAATLHLPVAPLAVVAVFAIAVRRLALELQPAAAIPRA
ncbi:MAG: DUF2029 domain-containing protein, partial [Alphaproteobacteria bacterium]|nr:DUF2029 domain-containing protein [Alphaproteobacteria bacterium]